jgi:hypothetical protein
MGAAEVSAFLTHLAVDGHVAASTQNQALSALLFLDLEKVSGLFSGEFSSDKLPRWEDQNVQTEPAGFITP